MLVGYIYLPEFLLDIICREQPHLAGKPLLVHREERLLAVSPELRERAKPGMRLKQALSRCPEAISVGMASGYADKERDAWLAALAQAAAAVEPVGEEEAFFTPAYFYGRSSKQVIQSLMGPWKAVIGIGTSKMTARLATHSGLTVARKKSGTKVITVSPGEETAFIRRFRLEEDVFFPAAARRQLSSLGVNTFAQAQQLSLEELLRLLGDDAYAVYLHCQGRDQLPVVGSYPPGELTVGYTCLPGEALDSRQLQHWIKCGVKLLASRLREQNQGCQKLVLTLLGTGKPVKAERTLTVGRSEEASLYAIFSYLAEQSGCPEGSDHLRLQVSGLYPLSFREQDLFAPRVTRTTEEEGLLAARESLLLRYPGAFASPNIFPRREAALAQCDPWRCSEQSFLRGESGVCSPAHP